MKIWGVSILLLIVTFVTCNDGEGEGSDRKKKLLVAKYSTRTHVSLTTITSTAILTCQLTVPNTATCKKRRRKRSNKPLLIEENKDEIIGGGLSPSSEMKNDSDGGEIKSSREGRLKIVFWSTVTSQYTITSTTINTGQTFSVSFFCSVGGASYPPLCG